MNKAQQKKFDSLYQQHVNALHRQGKAESTIDVYSRAVRRISEYYDLCPDRLTQEHLKAYFSALVKSHSWSTVKTDRNGLQFFYKHIINKKWVWVKASAPRQLLQALLYLLHPCSRAHAPYLHSYRQYCQTTPEESVARYPDSERGRADH